MELLDIFEKIRNAIILQILYYLIHIIYYLLIIIIIISSFTVISAYNNNVKPILSNIYFLLNIFSKSIYIFYIYDIFSILIRIV